MIIDLNALQWPASDVRGRQAIIPEARESIPAFLEFVPGRRTVIQAGGNVGVYPMILAGFFEEVVTIEPEAENFGCLLTNTESFDNITPGRFALAEKSDERLRINVTEPDNCGAHQCMPPIGDEDTVATVTIDELMFGPVDLIWLDVEGAELPALRGARRTIEEHSPAIILEEKNHGKLFGYSLDDLHAFLAGLGYRERAAYHNDRLYTR